MLKLISKYPFIKICKLPLKPEDYITIVMNGDKLTAEQKAQIRIARELLLYHRIPLNKIRFVFSRTFTYDVDTDVVNPEYIVKQPKRKHKNVYPIEIGKPENLMSISVGYYQTDDDDFENVRAIIKKTKKGVVITLDVSKTHDNFEYAVLMANLDSAIEFHKNIL